MVPSLDNLNGYVAFNKRLVAFLIESYPEIQDQIATPTSLIQLSHPQEMISKKNNGNDDILMFSHQASRLNIEEYYVNKKKPKKLEVIYP